MSDQTPTPSDPPTDPAQAAPAAHAKSASWADDDSDDEQSAREFQERLAAATPRKGGRAEDDRAREESPAPTSQPSKAANDLASRIGGLSTSESPNPPSSSSSSAPTKPVPTGPKSRAQPSNNLFGKALAGIKPKAAPAAPPSQAEAKETSQVSQGKEETFQGKELFGSASTFADSTEIGIKGKSKMDFLGSINDNDTNWGAPQSQPPKQSNNGWGSSNMNSQQNDDGWGGPSNGNGNGQANGNGNSNGNGHNGDAASKSGSTMDQDDSFLKPANSEAGSGLISNEFQVEVKLADLQADPNSPLYSAKAFEDLPLHPDLIKGIYAAGFKRPSKIQERALPLLLMNPPRNLIGQSQSGTGKTAAFTLDMLSRVDPNLMVPQAVCLAPSRELARQIQEVVEKMGEFTNITTQLAVPGGWVKGAKIEKHILIGTPGTLVDMLSKGTRIFDPKFVRVFVLDEADEMIAMQGLGDQTRRIQRMLPRHTQNVLFSATFPDEVRNFAESVAPEANKIFLKQEDVTVDAIKQLYLECDGAEQKFDALASLYEVMTIGQSIVFTKKRDTADQLAKRLQEEGHSVAALHGTMEKEDRDATLNGFREGKTKVLITTNVIARGIDIQQVNMVVNYDIPEMGPEHGYRPDVENYIHRIGRTGRFGRKGCAVTFAHDQRSMSDIQYIENETGRKMKRIDAKSDTDLDQLEKALKAAMKGPA